MITIPAYAYFAHLATLLVFISIFISDKRRLFVGSALFLSTAIISYWISFLNLSDYPIYLKIYDWVDPRAPLLDQPRPFSVEIGYLALMYVVKPFTENFDFIRISIIFIGLLIKLLFLMKWGKFYLVSFLFYLSFLWYPDSYLLRSSLSASLALIGFWAMLNRRPAYQYFLPIIFASAFHVSALLLLPLWWIRNISLSKQFSYFLLSLIVIIGLFGLGHSLVQLIAIILSVDIEIIDRLVMYSDSKYGVSSGVLRVSVFVYVTIAAAYIFFKDVISRRIPYYDNILILLLFSLFLLLGLSDFEVLADRLFRLTAFFFVIAVGHIFYCLKKKDQVIFFAIVITICNLFPYIEPGNIRLL